MVRYESFLGQLTTLFNRSRFNHLLLNYISDCMSRAITIGIILSPCSFTSQQKPKASERYTGNLSAAWENPKPKFIV